MSLMIKASPLRELSTLNERLNRMFNEVRFPSFQGQDLELATSWVPAVNIFENDQEVSVSVDLPGIKKEDVEITLENNVLTLKGTRKLENEEKRENYHRVERAYGTFARSFNLPNTVDAEKIGAEYQDGVLHIHLPKREESKPRQISVKVR
ncbi:MAG: Hsp20/alpha crystallin family protein [Acidobacteria bacterium]|nr:Hsp20/alpha crystallin family protein [Acidobacteriota bacterium]